MLDYRCEYRLTLTGPYMCAQSCPTLCDPHGLQPTRLLCPWNFPGKNTGVGSHSLLQGILLTQESNPGLRHCRQILCRLSHQASQLWYYTNYSICACVFSCVLLFVTPWTVACQVSLSMGFSRREYWSGLLFPSPGDPTHGLNPSLPCLLHWQVDSLPLFHLGSP